MCTHLYLNVLVEVLLALVDLGVCWIGLRHALLMEGLVAVDVGFVYVWTAQ